jgi:hypothetical protein
MKTYLATFAALLLLSSPSHAATQVDIAGPPNSGRFGSSITVLPNGNFVVVDPTFNLSNPSVLSVGAVYLFNPGGLLISTLHGSTANDQIGSNGITVLQNGNFVVRSGNWNGNRGAVTWGSATTGFIGGASVTVSASNSLVGSSLSDFVGVSGVTALTNGNYVVSSPNWDNTSPATASAGAVTWGNGSTGISGPVSAANSLVGSSANDNVGFSGVTPLTNGNYVVRSPLWRNTSPAAAAAGAVTWGNGSTGIKGPVTAANSLIGSSAGDQVGSDNTTALTNGNYVVSSPLWDNTSPVAFNAGAVTWGNGSTGISGPITAANSLVGSSANDEVGGSGVTPLTNGNYVVSSLAWDNTSPATADAGAVTWGNGSTGISGPVSATNSLVGTSVSDFVGGNGITPLTNGNYVVRSLNWDNTSPATANAGAVTWGNGSTGISGPVSAANSLVGASASDSVGGSGITPLTNGNYVVSSSGWDNTSPSAANAGAVTWGNGSTGISGPVSAANSLVGSSANDEVGRSGATALTNGNYVVRSKNWDNPSPATSNAGAVTWANGSTGIKGPVSASNSLVGSSANDLVGSDGTTALTNGNYVVNSPEWDNTSPAATDAGAVTWGNGSTGIKGPVTATNSLVGSSASDLVGFSGVTPLTNGNYVVNSPDWDNTSPATAEAGAVTWGNGSTGISGPVSAANSLVGSSLSNFVGGNGTTALTNGNYVVRSPNWDNTSPAAVNAGAVSLGNGSTGTNGSVSSTNSVLGTVASSGFSLTFDYDPALNQLIVGRPDSKLVTLFRGDRLRSLAKTSFDAPGAADIAFATSGTAAVNPLGAALSNSSLTGSGSSSGRNRALFAFSPQSGIDLVLQTGTSLSALGAGLPSNTTASTLFGQLFNRSNFGLFQATVKGTGISASNNRLILLDNGVNVQLLHRTGTPIPALANASFSSFTEVLQSHDQNFVDDQNLVTIAYKLKPGSGVTSSNDEGLFLLDPTGVVSPNVAAREGDPAFSGGGTFGSFTGRAATGFANITHFIAQFKPTTGTPVPALFSTPLSGVAPERLAKAGDLAPGSGGATYNTFTAVSNQKLSALVKATLKASPINQNEGLYSLPTNIFLSRTLLTRKDDPIGGGLKIARILRFWPAGPGQVILHVQVTGTNVNTSNNQVLVLRQSDDTYLTLLRTGTPAPEPGNAPGTGPAKLAAISAVDVNPVFGLYAVLGTLSGAPSSSNQALWTGDPTLGNNTTQQILRLPQLTLRKGNPYSTESTPNGIIRSIALKPAIDPTGAGGRGLAQALGANGDLALFITTDRNLTELVLLDR